MTVARSVADVLSEHVSFEVECIDRMYCNVYVPKLQYAAGLVGYVQRQLGLPIASTAPLAKITDRFSREVHRYAGTHAVPWVDFVKGQRKDDVMREHPGELVKSSVCGVLLVDVGGCSELGLFGSVTQACCERVGPGGDADRVVGLAEG